MNSFSIDPTALHVLIAALGGAAIGVERQWSGHATGPKARFAGVRTFTMLGGLAGTAGWLTSQGFTLLGAVLLAGAVVLTIAGYHVASAHDVDGTTEVAALVTLASGTLAGLGHVTTASAMVAITALLLVEKSRLHTLIARLDDQDLRAAARFLVMALVVLPLLPRGPLGPLGGIRPRQLWLLVLFFSGLSFVGYAAKRLTKPSRGYVITGLLGGLLSSTSVTLTFSRLSRADRRPGRPLAQGVLAACTVLFPRVLAASAVLNTALAVALLPLLLPPFLVGAVLVFAAMRSTADAAEPPDTMRNPLQIRAALEMAAIFQLVLFGVYLVQNWWGQAGLLASGAVLGLTDVDALTVSMATSALAGVTPDVAGQGLAIGILSNTCLKLGVVLIIGRDEFRRLAGLRLAALAVAVAIPLALSWRAA